MFPGIGGTHYAALIFRWFNRTITIGAYFICINQRLREDNLTEAIIYRKKVYDY